MTNAKLINSNISPVGMCLLITYFMTSHLVSPTHHSTTNLRLGRAGRSPVSRSDRHIRGGA